MKKCFALALVPLFALTALTFMQACSCDREPAVRNVILVIGDGMGLNHAAMLQIESDYQPNAFDRAEYVALLTTRSANNRVTDSSAAGTALASAHKTNNGTIGLDPEGRPLTSVMTKVAALGKATGMVVTDALQDATPAAFYAHVATRWDMRGITRAMTDCGFDLLFGGGRKWLAEECGDEGSALDAFRARGYAVIDTLPAADEIHSGRIVGHFAEGQIDPPYREADYLPRATRKALEILENNGGERGFLLMVEGSHIDHASHESDAAWVLAEMREFEKALAVVVDYAERTPGTLVAVVADHETGGLIIPNNDVDYTQAESGLNYQFGYPSHTAAWTPAYFYGTGAAQFAGVMDNTEFARRLMQVLGVEADE